MDGSQFSIPVKCFQMIGYHRSEVFRYPIFSRVFQVVGIICIIICFLAEVLFIKLNLSDVLAVAEAFAPLSIEIISLTKIITFFAWKEKFYNLMDKIKALSADSNAADLLLLKRMNKFSSAVGLAYLTSGLFATFGYCLIPVIKNLVNVLIFETTFNHEMPFKSAYPYDITKSPAYELSYAIFSWATCNTLFICVGVDCFFLGSCLNICGHLDILRDSFDGDKQKFIERHKTILNLAENLSNMMKPIVLVQYLITSMVLCVLGFQVVVLESFVKRIVVIFFGITVIIQLFTYSYGGQLIMDKSSSVADHLFQLDKDLVIIIRRAHKAVVVKSGFYEATLPAFSAILSSAASLITLLQSFIK